MTTALSNASYRLSHRATYPPSRQEPQPAAAGRLLNQGTDTYQGRRNSITRDPSSDHSVKASIEASSERPKMENVDRGQRQLPTEPTTEPTGGAKYILICYNVSSNLAEDLERSLPLQLALDRTAIENVTGFSSADRTPTVEAQHPFRDDIDIRSPTLSTASDLEQWEWSACAS